MSGFAKCMLSQAACVCVCVCVRERERERERKPLFDSGCESSFCANVVSFLKNCHTVQDKCVRIIFNPMINIIIL